MKESDLWRYIRYGLVGKPIHLTRIESSAGNGVPDVAVGLPDKHAWIELKYIPEWPKRSVTKVRLPLRAEQKHWISNRGKLSGEVWAICRIQDDFFLLYWRDAIECAEEGWTKDEWISGKHTMHWYKHVDFDELYNALMSA